MVLGMMGMVIFNLIDTYFVGKLGVQPLAAMSFSFPVVMFLNGLALGVGIGTSALISRNIVRSERGDVRLMASRALLLGVLVVLFFTGIGLFTIRPVFASMGADGAVLEYVVAYMWIWYMGVPFVVIPMIGNSIVRATGDTFVPGMIMVFIAAVNAVLDPLLIFGLGPLPEMGIRGAALATVFARAIGLVAILHVLGRREKLLTLRLGSPSGIASAWKKILYVAGPASLTMLITPISTGFVTKVLAGFGQEAVAAFGVATRVEMFSLMVIMALGSVLIIFVGQNSSRGLYDRVRSALRLSARFSILWGLAVFVLLLIAGREIAALFSTDETVIQLTKQYFLIVGASYGFHGLVVLSASSFNGLNRPIPSAVFSIVRTVGLYAPLAWALSRFVGVEGVFVAALAANVAVGLLATRQLYQAVDQAESA